VSEVQKAVLLWGVSSVVGFYCVFVMEQLWNWFAVPLLHFSEASFLTTYGLSLLIGLVTARDVQKNPIEETRWKILMLSKEACVPTPARENLHEQLKEEVEGKWRSMGSWVFGIAPSYTLTPGNRLALSTSSRKGSQAQAIALQKEASPRIVNRKLYESLLTRHTTL
jgi:hypothetical protein